MKPDKHSLLNALFEARWIVLVAALFFIAETIARQKKLLETVTWAMIWVAAGIWFAFFVYRLIRRKDDTIMRDKFKNYFSPQIADGIMGNHDKLKLGGERREVSIFFSDIRSFTKLTENLPPQRLTDLMQKYFTEMTAEIEATGGVVDKFIGDAIMAFWGAPVDQLDKADRAVATAIKMINKLKILNEKWQAAGYPAIDIGIGINTGVAIVGNIGSKTRFDYTVIGDDVNVAARLERLNRDYKTNIIISESTKKNLSIPVNTESLGLTRIRGRNKAIKIYKVEA